MLDPEWPAPLPGAEAVAGSRVAKRLAQAAWRRDFLAAPARQVARERRYLLFASRLQQAVREGLTALGFDPSRSRLLVENEARLAAELAALPPAENDPPPPPAPPAGAPADSHAERFKENFSRQYNRFREAQTPPPDLAKESIFTLWTFVCARSPRHGLIVFGEKYVAEYDAAMAEAEAVDAAQDEPDDAESGRYC